MDGASGSRWLPALALAFNAFTWGVSWWPFRELQRLGLHPLWATASFFMLGAALMLAGTGIWIVLKRRGPGGLLPTRAERSGISGMARGQGAAT